MTREEKEETIEYLKKYRELDKQLYQTAPFTSTARNALIKCLRHWDTAISVLKQTEDTVSRGVFEQVMWERDIAIDQLKELGYEFGQKIEPCEDAVSRQAVLKMQGKYAEHMGATKFWQMRDDIRALPSVTRQTIQKPLKCRNANCGAMCTPADAEIWSNDPKKCPNYKAV